MRPPPFAALIQKNCQDHRNTETVHYIVEDLRWIISCFDFCFDPVSIIQDPRGETAGPCYRGYHDLPFPLLTLPNIDELCTFLHLYRSYPTPTKPQRSTIRQARLSLSDETSVLMDYLSDSGVDLFAIDIDVYTIFQDDSTIRKVRPEDYKTPDFMSGAILKSDRYVKSALNYVSDAYLQAIEVRETAKLLNNLENYNRIPVDSVRNAITKGSSEETIQQNSEIASKSIVFCKDAAATYSAEGPIYNARITNAEHAAWFAVRSCGWCRDSNIFDLVVKASVYSDLAKREAGIGIPSKISKAADVRENARVRCLRRLAFYTQTLLGPVVP